VPRGEPVRSAASGPVRLHSELVRTLTSVDHQVERALGPTGLTPELVHDIHRDLRRLASGLSLWGQIVSASQRVGTDELVRRLRRLARLVGRVRDRDVTTALLAPAARRVPRGGGAPAWHGFLGRFREETHTGRELLRAFLTTERRGGLFDRARALLELPPRTDARQGLHRILAEERRRRQGRVRKAQRKALRRPTSARLHRLRIRIRQWRHLSALERTANAAPNHPPPPSWRVLQGRLGKIHDLDVALSVVPPDLVASRPARRLVESRRALRSSVRASLERIAARPRRAASRARSGARR
jgi:CHAD domain-containing protein